MTVLLSTLSIDLSMLRSATSAAMLSELSLVSLSSWSPSTVAVLETLMTEPELTVALMNKVVEAPLARLPMVQTSSPAPTT